MHFSMQSLSNELAQFKIGQSRSTRQIQISPNGFTVCFHDLACNCQRRILRKLSALFCNLDVVGILFLFCLLILSREA